MKQARQAAWTLAVLVTIGMGQGRPAQGQQPGIETCAELPQNIEATPKLRRHVEQLIAKSATLRRQCALIATAPRVRVVVRHGNVRLPGYCRARAQIVRSATALSAFIDLPISSSFPELLAHELEHVVEAIEGINLAARASQQGSGVVEVLKGVFETSRAKRAGRQAEAEIYDR